MYSSGGDASNCSCRRDMSIGSDDQLNTPVCLFLCITASDMEATALPKEENSNACQLLHKGRLVKFTSFLAWSSRKA